MEDEFPAIIVPEDPIPTPQNQPIPVITSTRSALRQWFCRGISLFELRPH